MHNNETALADQSVPTPGLSARQWVLITLGTLAAFAVAFGMTASVIDILGTRFALAFGGAGWFVAILSLWLQERPKEQK